MLQLDNEIQYVKGVGPKKAKLFNKLGIYCVADLVEFYPRDYLDWSNPVTVKECEEGQNACIKAELISDVKEHIVRHNLSLYKCTFSDGESNIYVTIFNNKYLASRLKPFEHYVLYGKVKKGLYSLEMNSPIIESASKSLGLEPIYHATEGLTSRTIAKVLQNAVENLPPFPETLPRGVINDNNLVSRDYAIRTVHFAKNAESLEKAKFRLIFEELLTLQLGFLKLKGRNTGDNNFKITRDYTEEFYGLLPFEPTNAQRRAVEDCIHDMQGPHPMNRLIQGDVGSGKTAVAAAAIYSAYKNGFQSAIMVPTEILANQHFKTLTGFFKGTGINVALITGSTPAPEKKEIKQKLLTGEIHVAVGTHALIQKDVEFKNLALIVTDEQHRFGVNQRGRLAEKSEGVHKIVMSATPIPRTLALMIYGDLDLSQINELPPGRQVIHTSSFTTADHEQIYAFVRRHVDRGEQAYIVCSLVDEGESDRIPATKYVEELSTGAFKGYNLGLLHGKMKAKEKDAVMQAFVDGDVKILVSTTVIEVGVDVPNATIMLIENAENYGLSQLHQLRGRVGRGEKTSFCVLVSDSDSEKARERINVMKQYSDGFKIAEFDLQQRGPGDFIGSRQHGLPNLKIADMAKDMEAVKLSREAANKILKLDPNLDLPQHRSLVEGINNMFREIVLN